MQDESSNPQKPVCALLRKAFLFVSQTIDLSQIFLTAQAQADLVIICFGRILDFENFHTVLKSIPPDGQVRRPLQPDAVELEGAQ